MPDEIKSLRNTFGSGYSKPSVEDLVMFRKALEEHTHAMDFLKINRNLSEETIKHFMLGYDYYRNFITLPESKSGELVNVAYRSLDKEPKVKYMKEKNCENWIFNEKGLDVAKEKQGILIVSNQFDCMSAWQAGFKNVVSVPVGKDGIGAWMDLFDTIPKIYIAFENNKKSKKMGIEFADRIGQDKCFEIQLPEDISDLNSYFKLNDREAFKKLIREAKPYYKYTYQDLGSVIESIKEKGDMRLEISCLPNIKLDIDYLIMISGKSGIGKTTYVMNLANKLVDIEIPTLIIPFERGVRAVGQKFLQVRLNKTEDQLLDFKDDDWNKVIPDIIDLPAYFAMPDIDKVRHIAERAKKIFGIKAVIIDHLDYNNLPAKGTNEAGEIKKVMTEWKNICLDNGIMMFVVHHIQKPPSGVGEKRLAMENLKGGSATYQVPEAVVMLSSPADGQLEIDVVKNNHGPKGSRIFEWNGATGLLGKDVTDMPDYHSPIIQAKMNYEKF